MNLLKCFSNITKTSYSKYDSNDFAKCTANCG